MVKALNKLFIETLKLSPDVWLSIALGIIVAAFLVTLIVGLVAGEFKKVKGLMSNAVAKPNAVIAVMQKMPIHISKQYKRARVSNMKPSDLVTEQECVALPYKRSLISKVWVATFVATVIAAALAFCAGPIAVLTTASGEADDAVLLTAPYIMTIVVLLVGGLLTLIGAIVGKVVYGGALKVFAKFAQAIDGDGGQAQAQAQRQQPQAQQAYAYAPEAPVVEAQPEYAGEAQAVYADNVVEQPMAAEPVYEPVMQQEQEGDEDIRRRAREEAMAQMRAQQAQAEQMAQAQAAAQQQQQEEAMAQLRAQQQAQAAQAAQAAARAQAQAAQAAQAQAAPTGSSSADSVIARIEQIDREGAPRETMREVATLLQQERAKPENKTPEQQKRLNEALSKLLKAMSAASKK